MEKVISLLFEIEKKANQIIESANLEKSELLEENETAITKMESQLSNENNTKINALMAQAEEELNLEKQQLIENCNKQLQDLEDNYKTNHDRFVKQVFHSVIQL